MNIKHIISRLGLPAYAATALLVATAPGLLHADDTDIYISNTPSPTSAPLVMFTIDYRANLQAESNGARDYFLADDATDHLVPEGTMTRLDVLRLSVVKVLSEIEGVKVGLMMSHQNSNKCAGPSAGNCSGGGYVLKGFEQLVAGDANEALKGMTDALFGVPVPTTGSMTHTYQGKELYFEFFRYLTGQGVYNGHNGWADFGTNTNSNINVDHPNASWDSTIEHPSEKRYLTPLTSVDSCAKIFAINFLFGVSQQEDDSDSAINKSKAEGGMEGISRKADFHTAISYMHDVDLADGTFGTAPNLPGKQNVTSYFITEKTNKTTDGYATAGGTQNAIGWTGDPQQLVDTLTSIFKEIISVSTTFVAASVPVNVFNRAESLDNVYIALFQAHPEGLPQWAGNLKKLKLATITRDDDSKIVQLVDKQKQAAIANDGRIRFDAVTHWTLPNSLPAADLEEEEVEGADGRVVDRGAAGQRIPGFIAGNVGTSNPFTTGEPPDDGPRKLFYDDGTTLAPLNVDTATAEDLKTAFGVATTTEAEALVAWMRGFDVDDLDNDGSTIDLRPWDVADGNPWILGDPLHSRPLPINYGARDGYTADNPLIYIAMGSNDGFMHFFRNTDTDATESGKEVWAFAPTAIMDEISALRENAPLEVHPKHPYTVDGAPSAWLNDIDGDGTIDDDGEESVYLYFGLRRGGNTLYALDVSNPNAPELAWTIEAGDAGFEELGQTWSRPQVGMVDYDADGTADPVVIFAGGYDPNKDTRGGSVGTDDTMGNAIYVVDATDGTLVWKTVQGTGGAVSATRFEHADMADSIPSDVTIVDTDGDQYVDRILVGDTGGNVWRSDIDGARNEWQTILLASIGRHSPDASGTEDDRRFFHRPDFVPSFDAQGPFDAVIIGSGNRPNPLDKEYTTKPENYLYVIKDRDITPPTVTAPVEDSTWDNTSFADITNNCLGQESCTTTPDLSNGWKLALEAGEGEKSLSTPLTLSNVIYLTTYLPEGLPDDKTSVVDEEGNIQEATCGPSEGSGLLYAISLADGRPALNYNTDDDDSYGDQSAEDRYKELDSAGIPADVVGINLDGKAYVLPPDLQPEAVNANTRWRTFWYEVENTDL